MNSVSLVLAMVLFLSSGLGVYAGFFILGGNAQFKAAPPRPSSIVSFTIVVFGSVLTHAVASTLAYWLDRGHASWALARLNHSPNPYELALQLTADPISISGSAISYLLFWTAVIPIIATLLSLGNVEPISKTTLYRFIFLRMDGANCTSRLLRMRIG